MRKASPEVQLPPGAAPSLNYQRAGTVFERRSGSRVLVHGRFKRDRTTYGNDLPAREQLAAIQEVARRLRPGPLVLVFTWIGVSWVMGVAEAAPIYTVLSIVIMSLLTLVREVGYYRVAAMDPERTPLNRARIWLGIPVGLFNLYCGIAASYAAIQDYVPEYRHILFAVIAVQFAIASGFTAPDRILTWTYRLTALGPIIFLPLLNPTDPNLATSGLILALFLFSLRSNRVSAREYWNSTRYRVALEARSRELEHASLSDPLTGIPNRRAFEAASADAYAVPSTLAAMIIDADHFKELNDRYGHAFGDDCLVRMAQALASILGSRAGLVARLGGEEFAVVLRHCTPASARALAEAMREAVNGVTTRQGHATIRLSCSIGVAVGEVGDEESWRRLLARADAAMYRAKTNGRNRVMLDETDGLGYDFEFDAPLGSAPNLNGQS